MIPATYLQPGQEYVSGTLAGTAESIYWMNIDATHALGVHRVLTEPGTIRIEVHNGTMLGRIEARTSIDDRSCPLTGVEGDASTLKALIARAEDSTPEHIRSKLKMIRVNLEHDKHMETI